MRPVLGERGITAGMPPLAAVSGACRADLHPTAYHFGSSCFFLPPFAPGIDVLMFPSLFSPGLLVWATFHLVCLESS